MAIVFTPGLAGADRSTGSLDKPKQSFADSVLLDKKALHPLYTATNTVMDYNDPQFQLDLSNSSKPRNR